MFDFITIANHKNLRTVKSSEVNELCDWIWSLLAEIKGYFTEEERESTESGFSPYF